MDVKDEDIIGDGAGPVLRVLVCKGYEHGRGLHILAENQKENGLEDQLTYNRVQDLRVWLLIVEKQKEKTRETEMETCSGEYGY